MVKKLKKTAPPVKQVHRIVTKNIHKPILKLCQLSDIIDLLVAKTGIDFCTYEPTLLSGQKIRNQELFPFIK